MERLVEHARRMVEESDMTLDAKMEVLDFLNLEEILKLREYEKLEEQGLLLRLPCKVGGVVYFISRYTNSVLKGTVETIGLRENFRRDRILIKVKTVADDYFYDGDFGKTVFLTKVEAEQKLAEIKGGYKNEH